MKEVKICKLQRVSNRADHVNWYYAYLLVKASTGNMMVKSGNFHKSFYMKEFDLTEDAFNKIEIIPAI